MKGIIQKIFDKVTKGEPKDSEHGKLYTRLDSVEQGYNILKAVEAESASGKHKADVEINTATEPDLVKFLNYGISLVPEKYAKHKMLLILRVNPIKVNQATGKGTYLSKKYIAEQLTKTLKRLILESEIDNIEKEAIKICQQYIRTARDTQIPILN